VSATFKRLLTWDGPATGQLCARKCTCGTCACVGETGDAFEMCPFYDQGGESWSDSEGIPWGFHCHGSKGPWLEVSVSVTCSAQVLSVSTRRREDSQDERSKQSWIAGKVETEVSTLCKYNLNTTTPRGFTPPPSYNNWPAMTLHDVISYGPART
jgi:hypothetical protein